MMDNQTFISYIANQLIQPAKQLSPPWHYFSQIQLGHRSEVKGHY